MKKSKNSRDKKQIQNEQSSSSLSSSSNQDSGDDFSTSLNFVKNIINGEKQKDETKNKIKNPTIHSGSLGESVIDFSNSKPASMSPSSIFEPKILKSPEPIRSIPPTTTPSSLSASASSSSMTLDENREETKQKMINKTLKNDNKKMGKKIKLGKVKNRVSVLLRNQTLKKKTDDYISRLKSDDLKKIKEFLSSNGFIKYGSMAPEQLLREMYVSIKTGGKLRNMKMDNYISKVSNIE